MVESMGSAIFSFSLKVNILIPEACEYAIYTKKETRYIKWIKLRILRWDDYLGLSTWPNAITRVFLRRLPGGLETKGDWEMSC